MKPILQIMEYRRVYWRQDYVCNCFSSLILIGWFSDWLILITGLSAQSVFLFGRAFRFIFVEYHKCLLSVIWRSFSRSSGLNKSISSNIFIAACDISTVNFGTENDRLKCHSKWHRKWDPDLHSTIPCFTNLLSKSLPNGIWNGVILTIFLK